MFSQFFVQAYVWLDAENPVISEKLMVADDENVSACTLQEHRNIFNDEYNGWYTASMVYIPWVAGEELMYLASTLPEFSYDERCITQINTTSLIRPPPIPITQQYLRDRYIWVTLLLI